MTTLYHNCKTVNKGQVYEGGALISGSALSMLKGVKNLVSCGCSLALASMAASDNPTAIHGLDCGVMEEGKAARLGVLDRNLNPQKVIF
jgi:N-acetylglucosamine-6-phosphate deacetylase